jgi:hypothetical protein
MSSLIEEGVGVDIDLIPCETGVSVTVRAELFVLNKTQH